MKEYAELNLDKNADWRIQSSGHGLGKARKETCPNKGRYRMANWPTGNIPPNYLSVTHSGKGLWDILFDKQDSSAAQSWSILIVDNSNGFTKAGVERINDSIRTYRCAIGVQSQTRTNILGTGTAFATQKHFLADIEGTSKSPVDLLSLKSRYENVLKYTIGKVGFVFGTSLYMKPSDMRLQISQNI